jgi:DNA-binding response OmpR family regulator
VSSVAAGAVYGERTGPRHAHHDHHRRADDRFCAAPGDDGRAEIELTPTEYRILTYLAQNSGHVVTQDLLLEHVWGAEYVGEGHMLQVNINRLRRKIELDPLHPRYILTKVGIGYLLAAQPDVATAK